MSDNVIRCVKLPPRAPPPSSICVSQRAPRRSEGAFGAGSLFNRRPNCQFAFAGDVSGSGKIVARTGLRMMPTSPRPLSFRKARFPRYGWKVACGTFPARHSA
jgi:hypothetical protein